MNKTELVNAIAKKTGQTATSVGEVLSAFEGVVTEAVASGDKVQLPGFLTFDRAERAAAHRPQPRHRGGDQHPGVDGSPGEGR